MTTVLQRINEVKSLISKNITDLGHVYEDGNTSVSGATALKAYTAYRWKYAEKGASDPELSVYQLLHAVPPALFKRITDEVEPFMNMAIDEYGEQFLLNVISVQYGVVPTAQTRKTSEGFDGTDKGSSSDDNDGMFHLDNLNTESGAKLREEVLNSASPEARKFFNGLDYDPLVVENAANLSEKMWHDIRKYSIGASDMAAVVGDSPFSDNLRLWHEKLGHPVQVEDTDADKQRKNLMFLWGHTVEPYIRSLLLTDPRFEGCRVVVDTNIYSNENTQFLTANLDSRLIWPDGRTSLLEFKGVNAHTKKFYENGSVPPHYMDQIQTQMYLTNVDDAYLIVLFDRDTFTVSHIVRDLDFQMELVQQARDFWYSNVLAEIEPIPNAISGESLIKTARKYKGKGDASLPPMQLDPNEFAGALATASNFYDQYTALKKQAESMEKKYKDAIAPVILQMGPSVRATCRDDIGKFEYSVKYTETPDSPKMRKADLEKLKRDNPALYAGVDPYISWSGGGRRLSLTATKI